jgi:hypothetical protein
MAHFYHFLTSNLPKDSPIVLRATSQKHFLKMAANNTQNNTETQKTATATPAETPRRPKEQHHYDRTYQCLIVYSEYDCRCELASTVRDPRCWKCEEVQPRLCRPSNWDIGADGLCPDCEMIRRGEELAHQRRLARGLNE